MFEQDCRASKKCYIIYFLTYAGFELAKLGYVEDLCKMCIYVCVCVYMYIEVKGKVIPLQVRCGPEGG